MDILPEIATLILDKVCNTRAYCQTSKLALSQCATRPDHARWQRIHSLNDYFVYGSASIVVWALSNVPSLVALNDIGLACALANATRADNVEAIEVLISRVSPFGLITAAGYCSEKTRKLFNVNWSLVSMWHCRCPRELGYKFVDLRDDEVISIISNPALSDEYLIEMLSDRANGVAFMIALEHNRVKLVLAMATHMDILHWLWSMRDLGYFRLSTALAALIPQTDEIREILEETRRVAIDSGLVDELGPEDAAKASRILNAALGKDDPALLSRAGISLYSKIAEHCSDDVVMEFAKNTIGHIYHQKFVRHLVIHGRVECLREILAKNIVMILRGNRELMVYRRSTIELAKSLEISLAGNIIDTTVDLYLAAQI